MSDNNLNEYIKIINKISPETLELIMAETNEEFDRVFDNWLTKAISSLESNKTNYKELDEEGLSAALASALTTGEINVTQEQNSNGHVDLTVKLVNSTRQRVKLGEAKIWRGKEYHIKGLDQLLNKYTTGRECRGFVISYVRTKNIKKLFEDLREYVNVSKPFDLEGLCKEHNIKWSFLSTHKHNSGELIEVCHVGCNLYLDIKK